VGLPRSIPQSRGLRTTLTFYTLGVLKQIEAMAGPLHKKFDIVFGTSTGSIIAALICLGEPVDEILALYKRAS
jgi:uncharacterized protein